MLVKSINPPRSTKKDGVTVPVVALNHPEHDRQCVLFMIALPCSSSGNMTQCAITFPVSSHTNMRPTVTTVSMWSYLRPTGTGGVTFDLHDGAHAQRC